MQLLIIKAPFLWCKSSNYSITQLSVEFQLAIRVIKQSLPNDRMLHQPISKRKLVNKVYLMNFVFNLFSSHIFCVFSIIFFYLATEKSRVLTGIYTYVSQKVTVCTQASNFSFIRNLKKSSCASKQDILVLATLRSLYIFLLTHWIYLVHCHILLTLK